MPHKAVVLLPTYNEADNLAAIVNAILQAAPVDVMVLDDASPDGTGALADAIAVNEPRVRVVHRPDKQGLGRAYLDGFDRALAQGYERIVQMDADFSHPPEHVPDLLKLCETHDVALASRWVPGGGTKHWPKRRQAVSFCGSLYARTLLCSQVHDLTGGFKCFRREVLDAIDFHHIDAKGYAFQIEMTYRAVQKGFQVVELPFVFVERQQGQSKMDWKIMLEAMIKVPIMRLRRAP